ncbi:MAG: hypothetical protein Q8J65_01765, partial [Nitrosomonadales bacterium]|nr:hypothetical protein [Nitrosomonadales bacterium]
MDTVPDIVDAVLYFLALLSLLIWTVGIAKFIAFYRNSAHDRRFLQDFAKATHQQELTAITQAAKGRLARICQAGLDELRSWQRLAVVMQPDEKR